MYFSGHSAQVYQVTRSGHEHCDVTEGILLDITPLIIDGKKLVTLYDKDLTEGVNLLIGKIITTECPYFILTITFNGHYLYLTVVKIYPIAILTFFGDGILSRQHFLWPFFNCFHLSLLKDISTFNIEFLPTKSLAIFNLLQKKR